MPPLSVVWDEAAAGGTAACAANARNRQHI